MTESGHWIAPPGTLSDGLTVALYGGSFDPAHEGHLHVARMALAAGADRVWWLVTPGNPLKDNRALSPLPQRLGAARRIARDPRIRVLDLETRLGTVYTADTVAALTRRFPRVQFVWLMGGDSLADFHRWKDWRRIGALVPILAVARPGHALRARLAPAIRMGLAPTILDGRRNPESATRLRALARQKAP